MRVLVADDHSLFRDGIVSLLDAAGFQVIGQVGDGQEAVEIATQLQPELVLLDITMPNLNGLEALAQIKRNTPETKVVMLTVSDDDEHLFAAIKAGASGYLLKNLNADEFLDMLEGIKKGEAAITRKTAARLLDGFKESGQISQKPSVQLTKRELVLLEFVGQGLSNRGVAQKLGVSENTVKYHMRNIMQKLEVQNRTEAVTHAMRLGLIRPAKKG